MNIYQTCWQTINTAEHKLGKLSNGQRIDLLLDNVDISSRQAQIIVDSIERRTKLDAINWRVNLAKHYAKYHGIKGKVGGWIYRENGKTVAQGWQAVYDRLRGSIWQFVNQTDSLPLAHQSWQAQRKAVADAIASFPKTFALAAWPQDTFAISDSESYVDSHSQIQLYTVRQTPQGWLSFAKCTAPELQSQIVTEPDSATAACESALEADMAAAITEAEPYTDSQPEPTAAATEPLYGPWFPEPEPDMPYRLTDTQIATVRLALIDRYKAIITAIPRETIDGSLIGLRLTQLGEIASVCSALAIPFADVAEQADSEPDQQLGYCAVVSTTDTDIPAGAKSEGCLTEVTIRGMYWQAQQYAQDLYQDYRVEYIYSDFDGCHTFRIWQQQ